MYLKIILTENYIQAYSHKNGKLENDVFVFNFLLDSEY